MNELLWSPIHSALEQRIGEGDEIILMIVPFVKVDALKTLLTGQKIREGLNVVCRWRPQDIAAGVSDLEVYTLLRAHGAHLFLNPDIHLKLYVFGKNVALNTSGNLTQRGLGYCDNANIEVGSLVSLRQYDWQKIYRIIDTSCPVDDALYARYQSFLEGQPKVEPQAVPSSLLPPARQFTLSALPALEGPLRLAAYYFGASRETFSDEDARRAMHDLVVYNVPNGLAESEFDRRLGEAFRRSPFVKDFVDFLRVEKSLRFGAVNNWIHEKCQDVPLPYRWEIKKNTHILYDWLVHYFPEISWDRPNYSQVIYWREPK